MSCIHFHSLSGNTQVSGRERAYAGILCHNVFCVSLWLYNHPRSDLYRQILPPDNYLRSIDDERRFLDSFQTWLLVQANGMLHLPDGTHVNVFESSLNTAVVMGSDSVRLQAKLHGQCEIHAYIEGHNRAWLAGVIEQGIEDKVLRTYEEDYYGGWPSVVDLLKSRDDEPVVTSYSVTEQFPNRHVAKVAGWESQGEDGDDWYDLPDEEQWEYALKGLRKQNEQYHLEIKPEDLAQQGYGNGMSGFDIMAILEKFASK